MFKCSIGRVYFLLGGHSLFKCAFRHESQQKGSTSIRQVPVEGDASDAFSWLTFKRFKGLHICILYSEYLAGRKKGWNSRCVKVCVFFRFYFMVQNGWSYRFSYILAHQLIGPESPEFCPCFPQHSHGGWSFRSRVLPVEAGQSPFFGRFHVSPLLAARFLNHQVLGLTLTRLLGAQKLGFQAFHSWNILKSLVNWCPVIRSTPNMSSTSLPHYTGQYDQGITPLKWP